MLLSRVLTLLITFRYISTFEYSKTLNFLEPLQYEVIYEGIMATKFSFGMPLPHYRNMSVTFGALEGILQEIMKLPFGDAPPNGLMLEKLIEDIQVMLLKIKGNMLELLTYSGSENSLVVETCHTEVPAALDIRSLKFYLTNVNALLRTVDLGITKEEIMDDKNAELAKLRAALSSWNDLTEVMLYSTNTYLDSVKNLADQRVSPQLLTEIHRGKCLDADKFRDFVHVQHCTSSEYYLNCTALLKQPINPHMFVKLLPIPYRGYELDLDNVYYDPKNKNDGLFKINCENYKPVRADCSIERLSTECAYALQNVRVENVISYCPFRDSQLKNPTQLLTGILIPNLDDFKVYVLKNFSDPDTGSILPLPTDTLTDVPLIVASERPIKVSEEKFEFIFRYSAQKSFIRFTSLSEMI